VDKGVFSFYRGEIIFDLILLEYDKVSMDKIESVEEFVPLIVK